MKLALGNFIKLVISAEGNFIKITGFIKLSSIEFCNVDCTQNPI